MPSQALIEAARQRKEQQGRRGKARKAPPLAEPRQLERRYQAELLRMVLDLEAEIRSQLIDALPRLAQERDMLAPRADSWADDIDRIIASLSVFGRQRAERVISGLEAKARDVSEWSRRQFAQSMSAVLGVNISRSVDGEWLRVAMTSWSRENAQLITSVHEDLLTQVEGIAQRAMRSGRDPRDTAREIRQRFGVSESRARLIGRDQVSKLNGQITKSRNEALGLNLYDWSTSSDERVRESHRVLNGKVCRWDDDTVYADSIEDARAGIWKSRSSIGGYEGIPGEDYACRCGSAPVLDDILEQL